MDLHIISLHKEQWEEFATPTQFMRDGSSHELCSLTLTEILTHSTRNFKIPTVHVYLDKEAAFDSALKEHVIREVFSASGCVPSQSIIYLANRLASRRTFLTHDNTVMEPILDGRGVEHGKINQILSLTHSFD